MTTTATTWTVRRSRVPDLAAGLAVLGSGFGGLMSEGWLWWSGAAAAATGAALLARAWSRPCELLRLTLGERNRLERVGQGCEPDQLLGEGPVQGCSVAMPCLIALRIGGIDGTGADLVLTPGCAPPDDLRRLRVHLLTADSPAP